MALGSPRKFVDLKKLFRPLLSALKKGETKREVEQVKLEGEEALNKVKEWVDLN